jgi:VWFA-related protein
MICPMMPTPATRDRFTLAACRRAAVLAALTCVAIGASPAAVGAAAMDAAAATGRTVYVSVTDAQGAPVADLTPADFVVKEGGKECEITSAEPAKAKLRLALLIEERLAGDGNMRQGVFEFVKRLQGSAEIALIVIGIRNTTIVDYTGSLEALVNGLNRLSLNPSPDSNVTEGILEVAKSLEQQKPERPAMVVLAVSGGQAGGAQSKDVIDRIRQSGAVMHSVTLAGGDANAGGGVGALSDASNREQVLGDGAKQSGGRRVEIVATGAAQKALQQIAGDLLGQYAIRYALPGGAKPDKRFNASVKRKGVTLRAPIGIPDK